MSVSLESQSFDLQVSKMTKLICLIPFTLGWNMGIYTFFLSLQTYSLNTLFTKLNQNLDLFPRVLKFIFNFRKSIQYKEEDCTISAKKNCVEFCTDAIKGNLHKIRFFLTKIKKICKYFWLFEFAGSRAFQKRIIYHCWRPFCFRTCLAKNLDFAINLKFGKLSIFCISLTWSPRAF